MNNKVQFILIEKEEELLNILQESYKIKICEETKQPISLKITTDEVQDISKVLQKQISTSNPSLAIIKQIYRCLRNFTVLNEPIQNYIADSKDLLETTHDLLISLTNPSVNDTSCIDMVLLFLTNLVVNNTYSGKIIWTKFQSDLETLIEHNVAVTKIFPLIYNIFCKNLEIKPTQKLLIQILDLAVQKNDSEYILFLLEHFIRNDFFLEYYTDLCTENKITILEEVRELILSHQSDGISKEFLIILVREFKTKSDCILKTVTDYLKQIEPYEVSLLLDIIASISSNEKYLELLQADRSLMINCAFLLKSMHSAGKEGDNHFTAIQKLSEVKNLSDDVASHPAFGFKAALIRILGNLAWKSRTNQDELRDLDCIPLLLDCCNIDARNPLIIQWVIFAIRNISEKNQENQNVIASLTKQGVIDSSTLNELGLTLNDDGDNKIGIIPLVNK